MKTDIYDDKWVVFKPVGVGSILVVFLLALVFGCAGQQQNEKSTDNAMFMDEWKKKAETAPGYSPSHGTSPASRQKTRQENDPVKIAKPTAPGKKARKKPLPKDEINMKMHQVHIPVLLKALARIANQNIMINENVRGTASINIKSAPWDQVFEGVLRTNGPQNL